MKQENKEIKEEIQETEVSLNEKENGKENIDYSDDEILTPENKKKLKKMMKTEEWGIITKMIEELKSKAEEEILNQAKCFSAVKSHGYTIYDIQGAWIDGLGKIKEILEAVEQEDEVKKAVEEVNDAEAKKNNL